MMLMAGYPNPNIKCDGASFDGTNDWLSKAADLSGVVDGSSGILSCWIRLDGNDGFNHTILRGPTAGGDGFIANRPNANRLQLIVWDNTDTFNSLESVDSGASPLYTTSATWLHILASWKTSVTTASHFYINDVNRQNGGIVTTGTCNYTPGQWFVGGDSGGTFKAFASMAELYFAPNQFLDFSIVANRRRFYSVGGKPVHLGTNGSLATGTAPAIYLHLDHGETANNFATNRGTGGNFTVNGALTTASTSPSD